MEGTLKIMARFAGGLVLRGALARDGAGAIALDCELPAGISATLTNRVDDYVGQFGVASGHGLSDGPPADYVDVHWTDADGVHRLAHGMEVTSVSETEVTAQNGAGDVLPDQGSSVVLGKRTRHLVGFDGDLATLVVLGCDRNAHVHFRETDTTSIHAQRLDAGEAWHWASGQGVANPLTGDPVGEVQISNGQTTAGTLRLGVIYQSD